MKSRSVIMVLLLLLSAVQLKAHAQEQTAKTEKIVIKTSAVCQQCKDRIEKNMAFEKGVRSVKLDLETKDLTVEYRTGKTTPDKLKKAVTKIGYDADELEADPKAYEKLPACCKKDAPPH
jgi:periplasmic mercuric ion binding protein